MSYVMEISKPGYNVLITDNKNLSFSSELATHSIYNVATITWPPYTFHHGLGYIPKTWIFRLNGVAPNDYYSRIPIIDYGGDGRDYYITDQDIVIENATDGEVYKVVIFTRSPNP